MGKTHAYTIRSDVSDWLYDLLPLRNSYDLSGEFLEFSTDALCGTLGFKHSIDYVYPLDNRAIIAVSLRDQTIAIYDYKKKTQLDQYRATSAETWQDVFCLSPLSQESSPSRCYTSGNTYAASIYILTKNAKVIKLNAETKFNNQYSFVPDYEIDIPSPYPITRILPCREKEAGRYSVLDTFYLWLPSKGLLQKYSRISSASKGKPTLQLSTEIKLKFPDSYVDGGTSSKVFSSFSLYLDEVGKSAIVADSRSQCVFEFSLTEKYAKEIYPLRKGADNREEEASCLYAPSTPLVFRPQEFVQGNLMSGFSRGVIQADATGVLPRILLVFDKGRLLKIWQFPEASAALDLSGQICVSTLMEDAEYASDAEHKPQKAGSNELRSMSIGSAGQLAVVADQAVYLLFSGVSSAESGLHTTEGLSKDS